MSNTRQINETPYAYAIFAAQPNQPHDVMRFLLDNNIDFQIILGMWKGQPETSYCIPFARLADVALSGLIDAQESVLVLGPYNPRETQKAYLLTQDAAEPVPYGDLIQVTRAEAEASESWSYSLMAKSFHVVRPAADGTGEQPSEGELRTANGE